MIRPKQHLMPHSRRRNKTHRERWLCSLAHNGKRAMIVLLASDLPSAEVALAAECDYIRLYKRLGARLTNATDGGEAGHGLRGEDHPMWGKSHSSATKATLSRAAKGRRHTAETKAICASAASRTHTLEHRQKIAAARGIAVTVLDTLTSELLTFGSCAEAAAILGLASGGVSGARRSGRLYKNRYIIRPGDSE